jgi:hypothetical protein
MSCRGAWARAGYRILAVTAAVLCLSAQLAGFAHMFFVRHVTCPEHGELLDVSAVDDGPLAEHVDRQLDSLSSGRGDDVGHQHDHCLVAAIGAQPMAGANPPAVVHDDIAPAFSPAPAATVAAVRGVERSRVSIALLLLAPKSSPPEPAAAS